MINISKELMHRVSQEKKVKTLKTEVPMSLEYCGRGNRYVEYQSEAAQSCLTLCNPMDCSLQGSCVHGIFQARIPEWAAISFSRGSSQPRDRTWVFRIVGRCFNIWATREVPTKSKITYKWNQIVNSFKYLLLNFAQWSVFHPFLLNCGIRFNTDDHENVWA